MKLDFELIILCLFFWILISKKDKKLIPVVITLLCVDGLILFIPDMPFFHSGRMAIFNALIFCSLLQYGNMKNSWSYFPFKYQLFFILVTSLIIGFFSQYIPDLQHRITKPLFEFTGSYILLFIAYFYSGNNTFNTLKKTFLICAILLTLVGIINGIFRYNPYIDLVDSIYPSGILDFAHMYTHRERFRISSLFTNPFDYGYVCLLINVIAIYLKQTNKIEKYMFCILSICSFFGIVFCNCRTIIIVYIIGISIYFILSSKLNSYITYMLLFVIVYSIAYINIPIVEKKTDQIVSVFVDSQGKYVKGSNLNMRATQLLGSIYFFKQNPIVGNGYDYIADGLGWRKQQISGKTGKMAGYESIIFILLIEKGIIGIISYLLFYGSILFYLIKNRKCDVYLTALGVAIFCIYIFFSIAAGELLSVPITLVFLGIIVKQIEIKRLTYLSFIRYKK